MIGRTLSHYKVLEEISREGMGTVYKVLKAQPRGRPYCRNAPRFWRRFGDGYPATRDLWTEFRSIRVRQRERETRSS